MPWRYRGGGVSDDVLIHGLVSIPQRALGDISHRKFPVLRRLVQPVEKPLALLLLRDVEEEFEDDRAIAREVALEPANILEPLAPDVFGYQPGRNLLLRKQLPMHPRHQAFFVIRAIEDADAATLRQRNHA